MTIFFSVQATSRFSVPLSSISKTHVCNSLQLVIFAPQQIQLHTVLFQRNMHKMFSHRPILTKLEHHPDTIRCTLMLYDNLSANSIHQFLCAQFIRSYTQEYTITELLCVFCSPVCSSLPSLYPCNGAVVYSLNRLIKNHQQPTYCNIENKTSYSQPSFPERFVIGIHPFLVSLESKLDYFLKATQSAEAATSLFLIFLVPILLVNYPEY